MGIRPSIKLVLGINDLQRGEDDLIDDPRFPINQVPQDHLVELPDWPSSEEIDADIGAALDTSLIRLAVGEQDEDTGEVLPKPFWKLLYDNAEMGVPSLFGLYFGKAAGPEEWLYALALVHPEYQQPIAVPLPSRSLEDDASRTAQVLKWFLEDCVHDGKIDRKAWRSIKPRFRQELLRKKRHIQQGTNYDWLRMEYESRLLVAQYVFEQLDISIPNRDLKLYLVVDWG